MNKTSKGKDKSKLLKFQYLKNGALEHAEQNECPHGIPKEYSCSGCDNEYMNKTPTPHSETSKKKIVIPKKFTQVNSGEWVYPTRKGYLMKCCDCGLVHSIDFDLIKKGKRNYIILRAKRI